VDRKQTIKALPTKYNGVWFRSRLEARWAVYFNYFGIEWEYEFQGFKLPSGCYLPDFWLPQVNLWAEVKPSKLTKSEELKVEELVLGTEKSCLLLIGSPKATATPLVEPLSLYAHYDDYEEEHMITIQYSSDLNDPVGSVEHSVDSLEFNKDRYEPGNLFGSGLTLITDVVISDEKLDENRFYHSTGLNFTDNLDGFFMGVEEAVSAALSARF